MHWNDPLSLTPWPQTMFLSYYLQGLTVENGCLQVIPGSHLRRTPLHDDLEPLLGPGQHGAVLVGELSTGAICLTFCSRVALTCCSRCSRFAHFPSFF